MNDDLGLDPRLSDVGLSKRLHWIGQCAKIIEGYLHHFHKIGSNTSTYFWETLSVHGEPRKANGYWITMKYLESRVCYYLGTYPNRWNAPNERIVFPHNYMTPDSFPVGKTLNLRGNLVSEDEKNTLNSLEKTYGKDNLTKYFHPERYTKEAIESFSSTKDLSDPERQGSIPEKILQDIGHLQTFYSNSDIQNLLEMNRQLGTLQSGFDACKKINYPRAEKPTQTKAWSPQDIKEISLPTPEKEPTPIPGETTSAPGILRGRINLSIKPNTQVNTLILEFSIV